MEDLFPELKRVTFSNYNYSYSSYRKALVSSLRGIGFRDPVIARILGQDALDSQNTYDRVAKHEFTRSCELSEAHVEAMTQGKSEYYPSIPYDFFEKTIEQFGIQEKILQQLLAEFKRLLEEVEERAQQRHTDLLHAVQKGGSETHEVLARKLESMENRMRHQFASIEARMAVIDEMGRHLIRAMPNHLSPGTRDLLITCMRFLLLCILMMVSGNRSSASQTRFAASEFQMNPPRDDNDYEPDFMI